ncbi:MAG: DUF1344 domain-containing protein [Amphiplicatus sp.]
MKMSALSALAAGVVLLSSTAVFAAESNATMTQTATGVVSSIDKPAHLVKLDNGVSYKLPAGYDAGKLRSGEKVEIVWKMQNGQHQAQTVTEQKS